MNSFAHYSFGAVCEWLFFQLAGIDSDRPGWKHIVLRPTPPSAGSNPEHPPIDWVKARYDSVNGRIVSDWKLKDGQFELETAIPANTTATVHLPAKGLAGITVNGRSVDQAEGVRYRRMEDGRAVLEVVSGSYRFASRIK